MKYMFLIYSPESEWSKEEWTECTQKSSAICEELAAQGKFQTAAPLCPVATAATVRIRNGERQVTTGPFAETIEQLGGYYILELENLDEAIAIAASLPPVHKGTVEIRPIRDTENLPPARLGREPPAGMKKFMFLCYDDEQYWQNVGPEVHSAAIQRAVKIAQRLDSQRHFVSAAPLHPTFTATSVRVRDGKRLITDGPFAETREVLGGYYLLFARDQPEALAIASEHPGVHVGAVEVRQVFDLEPLASSGNSP